MTKPDDDRGYADALKAIRVIVNPVELVVDVKGIRRTRSGDVLVEIEASQDNKTKFGYALSSVVGEPSSVRPLKPRLRVEIRNLDAATEEAGIRTALHTLCGGGTFGDYRINLSRENKWGSLIAFVEPKCCLCAENGVGARTDHAPGTLRC